jgi:hypothetical protein
MKRRDGRQPPWFAGKYTQPNIPPPEPKEEVKEQLIHPVPHQDTRPHMVRPAKEIHEPHFNELYDSLRTKQAWRYAADLSVHGSVTSNIGSVVSTAITLPQAPNFLLKQWPMGTQLYLVIRSFGIAPKLSTVGIATETSVPATASNLIIFTGPGMLLSGLVTATGTADLLFSDTAGGNTIGIVPLASTVGQIFSFNMPFNTSLIAHKTANTPVVTVGYSQSSQGAPPFAPSFSSLEVSYIDTGGNTTYLGEFRADVGGNIGVDTLLTSPITDTGSINVGTLLVLVSGGFSNPTYQYSIGFSTAYLLPTKEPYSEHIYRDNPD